MLLYLGHCLRCTRNYCPLTGNLKLKTNGSKKVFSQIRRHTLLNILHSVLQGVVSSVLLREALLAEAWCFNNHDFVVSGGLAVRQRGTFSTRTQDGPPRK